VARLASAAVRAAQQRAPALLPQRQGPCLPLAAARITDRPRSLMTLAWLCWVGRSQEAEPRGLISLQQVSQIKVTSEDAAEYAAIITTGRDHIMMQR